MQPYSMDLRERVVKAAIAGQSSRAVAATFGVSVASVVKWTQKYRETGDVAPRPQGYKKPHSLAGERAWLLGRIAAKPDMTLRGLMADLADRGTVISYFGIWLFFKREGISFKKKRLRDRAGSARRGHGPLGVEGASRAA